MTPVRELMLQELNQLDEIFNEHPWLIPTNNFQNWIGFMQNDAEHPISIDIPEFSAWSNRLIEGIHCKILEDCSLNNTDQEENPVKKLREALNKLKSREKCATSSGLCPWNHEQVLEYQKILLDIEHCIQSKNVSEIDKDLKWIELKYTDDTKTQNKIKVGLRPKNANKSSLQIIEIDLPDEILSEFSQINSLGQLYDKFKSVVDSLIPFWDEMEELNKSTWIIEPQTPKRKDIHRRILINDCLSVMLTFNPLLVTSLPDIKFLGSVKAVADIRVAYQQNFQVYGGWNEGLTVAENLMRLCEIENFPLKPKSSDEEDGLKECVICFTTVLDNNPPLKLCPNLKCSALCHESCLLEWLRSVPHSLDICDHIVGPCPYCDEKIVYPVSDPF